MFFKKKIKIESRYDGIVTFYNSFNAMKAEKTIMKNGIDCKLVHSPRELSPTCGVALAFKFINHDRLKKSLKESCIDFEKIHEYS